MDCIEINKVKKIYQKDSEEVIALKENSYKFESGKFYVIIGNSGSGKSTLLQCMGTLDKFTSGKLIINDKDVSLLNSDALADIRRDNIGFVYQSFYLNPNLTALQNIILPMYLNKNMTKQEMNVKGELLLKNLNMGNRLNHLPKELSGGEQQRVAIARALANDPSIILADEPTGNLDKENELVIYEVLKSLSKKGKCVIVVSHNENILPYADKIIRIKDGVMESVA